MLTQFLHLAVLLLFRTQTCRVACIPKSLSWNPLVRRFLISNGSSWSSNRSNPGAHTPHLWPRNLWPASDSAHSSSFQDWLGAAADPMNVILQPNPREPVGCCGIRLGGGVFHPKHEHVLHGT